MYTDLVLMKGNMQKQVEKHKRKAFTLQYVLY